jgi:cell wall-associated NlpC family hydrolase
MRACALALVALMTGMTTTPATAQGVVGQIGRFYDDGGWTLYRLGLNRPFIGPVGLTYHGDYFTRAGDGDGSFIGAGIDLTAFRTGATGPYAVAGLGGGIASPHARSYSSFWGSWSAGAGYDLLPAPFLTFGAEIRWREISLDDRGGLELAAGLGFRFGVGRGGGKPAKAPEPGRAAARDWPQPSVPAAPVASAPAPLPPASAPNVAPASYGSAALADSVVETATEMMGRPYEYGGTGGDGDGFDCSGLIQYAYGRHGVTLPRRSTDQALQGRGITRNPDVLRAGDILTFSSTGGPVTHVALYIGNGQFIHSATGGVQISLLSPEDPYGRWWYQRWVGARRILGT